MCGIAGFTHVSQSPAPDRIREATFSLTHRGPDQQGVYEDPSISLGAVRLRIIDLTGGEQPITGDSGTVIVFNGEIYNHVELRRELEGYGRHFRSRCDTEVVLQAFEQWDTACFARLRGMFAVALWQPQARRLVLARDRMGIKPLYIHRRGQDLMFGSELKAILAHPEVERTISREGLDYYLSLNYVPCPYTLVDGIEKLPPGQWLEWRNGTVTTEVYWRLEFQPRRRSLAAAKEELDALLRDAVREHLISDVPLGVWASGGLDSSTMVHYAAQAAGARLKTFSVSFLGRSFDESRWFREVAGVYDTDHHEFDLNPSQDIISAIEELPYYSDEPSADAGALPVWFLSKMSKRHVTVVLSGEGADELFGGYYTYLADRYARALRLVPAPLRRVGLAAVNRLPVSDDKVSFEYKLKRFLGGSLLHPDEAHVYWNGAFSDAEKCALARFTPSAAIRNLYNEWGSSRDLNRYLRFDQVNYLPDDILYKCDRMSMAHALEVRPAFLDHRIVEYAASLPADFKVRGSCLKFVLRELMRDKLPASVIRRGKQGFDIPAHDWFRGPLKTLLCDTLSPAAAHANGLLRPAAVDTLIRQHLGRRANFGFQLWGLLILFLWIRQWKIRTTLEPAAVEYASQPIPATN